LLLASTGPVLAQATFHGPVPYLSEADRPPGFFAGPHVLEDFEDGYLDFGVTADLGVVIQPASNTDSVDADDGVIDGSGNGGRTLFAFGTITLTFSRTVREAAVVWTDGPAGTGVTFEAFGPGMVSLGVHGPFYHADNVFTGTTAEDRFYGVTDPGGIVAIALSSIDGNLSIELDHLQFTGLADSFCGPAVPNSTGLPGRIVALGSAVVADSDLELYVAQLPVGEFGYFLVSSGTGSVVPPGSQGVLCLSLPIGRYNQVAQILQGPGGSLPIDLNALPLAGGLAVLPGDTWNFQCWYRDSTSSNFTDAVGITFQ
jgi:hypothetical protein